MAVKSIIPFEAQDVHTAVENALIQKLRDVGNKLHTARSRNDQVLVDLRLFAKDQLRYIADATLNVSETLYHFALKHQNVPIPGRTHFQRAMPSSIGLWAGAFAESMLALLQTAP
jgi:argininosuccinate lyase